MGIVKVVPVCYKKERGVFEMVNTQAIDQQKGARKVKKG